MTMTRDETELVNAYDNPREWHRESPQRCNLAA